MDYVSSIAALNRVVRHLSQSLMVDKRMALKVVFLLFLWSFPPLCFLSAVNSIFKNSKMAMGGRQSIRPWSEPVGDDPYGFNTHGRLLFGVGFAGFFFVFVFCFFIFSIEKKKKEGRTWFNYIFFSPFSIFDLPFFFLFFLLPTTYFFFKYILQPDGWFIKRWVVRAPVVSGNGWCCTKKNNGGEEITVKETGGEKKGVKNQVECRSADAGHGHNGWNSRWTADCSFFFLNFRNGSGKKISRVTEGYNVWRPPFVKSSIRGRCRVRLVFSPGPLEQQILPLLFFPYFILCRCIFLQGALADDSGTGIVP